MPGSPTSTISSPTSAMEEALAADSGLTTVLEEAAVKGRCTQRRLRDKGRPDLLSDSELATIDLRFAVGDKVRCCVATDDFEEGVVVRRCYREDDWPSGHYAAYQVRLDHCEAGGCSLIYAPRDDDCYIRRPVRRPATIASSRRLSQERRFLQKLEASLSCSSDDRKQMMYDTLRERHKQAMQRVIDDVARFRNPCVIV